MLSECLFSDLVWLSNIFFLSNIMFSNDASWFLTWIQLSVHGIIFVNSGALTNNIVILDARLITTTVRPCEGIFRLNAMKTMFLSQFM